MLLIGPKQQFCNGMRVAHAARSDVPRLVAESFEKLLAHDARHARQADESMLALVRLLARQAAREASDQAVEESDRSVEEDRE